MLLSVVASDPDVFPRLQRGIRITAIEVCLSGPLCRDEAVAEDASRCVCERSRPHGRASVRLPGNAINASLKALEV